MVGKIKHLKEALVERRSKKPIKTIKFGV